MKYTIKIRDIRGEEIKFIPVPGEVNVDDTKEGWRTNTAIKILKGLGYTKGVIRFADEDGNDTGDQIEVAYHTKTDKWAGIAQTDIFAHSFDIEQSKAIDAERICPECGKKYHFYPALSRLDNETAVCGECGTQEAVLDYEFGMWDRNDQYGERGVND